MLVFKPALTVWWPVTVLLPSEEGDGTLAAHEFRVEFELLDKERLREMASTAARRLAGLHGRAAELLAEATEKTAEDGDARVAVERIRLMVERAEAMNAAAYVDDGHQAEVIRAAVRGWKDLVDEAGASVAFSAALLDKLLGKKPVADALWKAWREATSGEARAKNSDRPDVPGPRT